MKNQQKPEGSKKNKKTDQICLRLPIKTIDYLNKNKKDEDESTPSVARRKLEQLRAEDEEKGTGG